MVQKKSQTLGLTQSQRPPRPKLSFKGDGEISRISGSTALTEMHGTVRYVSTILVDPVASSGPIKEVSKNYETYKVDKFTLHYTPAVGTTTPGKIWVGYTDNPEIIKKAWAGDYTPTTLLDIVKTLRHNNVYPVWQQWSMNIPNIAPRRKMYSIEANVVPATLTPEAIDRDTHGMFLVYAQGCPDTDLGVLTSSATYACRGLQSYAATGI